MYKLSRILPVNLKEEDRYLFERELELEGELNKTELIKRHFVNGDMIVFNRKRFHPKSFKRREAFRPTGLNAVKFLAKSQIKKSHKIHQGIWITDTWSIGYFHWFCDVLQKYFTLPREMRKWTLLLPENLKKHQYISESLELLGISHYWIKKDSQVFCDNLITFDTYLISGNFYRDPMIELHQAMQKIITSDLAFADYKLVYVSRSQASIRKVINEKEIRSALEKLNFKIVELEKYNWTEQLGIFSNAEVIVSMHGAGLTNMIFMRSGSKIIEFRHPQSSVQNCYFSLSSIYCHEYYYLVGKGADTIAHTSDLSIDQAELETLLAQINID